MNAFNFIYLRSHTCIQHILFVHGVKYSNKGQRRIEIKDLKRVYSGSLSIGYRSRLKCRRLWL